MIHNNKIGVAVPSIMLPKKDIDMKKWSIIACDQYTSQPEYWEKASETVADSPSTLNLIFPEVYLNDDDKDKRISDIHNTMQQYISQGILKQQDPGFVYLDRQTAHTPSRKGLIIALDLEQYDYNRGADTLIRATEGTVLDRIPPRMKIRQNAAIELPHIMILIDDPGKTVIEPLADNIDRMQKLYDFDLMLDGGHIEGYKVDDKQMIQNILNALESLCHPQVFSQKYGVNENTKPLLFAVGDGNHSLATAKACWEKIKQSLNQNQIENHPARYALVELVNIHDQGISFEPIHRVVFNVNAQEIIHQMKSYFKDSVCTYTEGQPDISQLKTTEINTHKLIFMFENKTGIFEIKNPIHNLAVGSLQSFLDEYLNVHAESSIDYIHGQKAVQTLSSKDGNIGFLLPPMPKNQLFKTIILDGVLPRKTFSMGEAEEKRYYLEARKIV
ncbi:MAG: DUF1015 domain-containing protein [Clostridia bacterium]|nr:DUF1015 domain-containing protein [Clostridia bacterium]